MTTSSHMTRLLVGGVNVSCIALSAVPRVDREMIDRTSLCVESPVFIKGQRGSSLTVGAMFDDSGAAGSYWEQLTANYTADTPTPVTAGPAGLSAGSPVWMAEAYQMAYRPNSAVGGGVDLGLDFATTGLASFGQSVTDLAAVTATGVSAAVDGGASSANGGIGHLHVTAATAPTTLNVLIEHSVNGSTSWATLATFTQITTTVPASRRVVVAAGTTVRRYLRASFTVAGTSYTCSVAFARS